MKKTLGPGNAKVFRRIVSGHGITEVGDLVIYIEIGMDQTNVGEVIV